AREQENSVKSFVRSGLAVAALSATAAFVHAQEAPAEPAAPVAEEISIEPLIVPQIPSLAGEAVPMSLRDAVLATLAANLDVAIEEKDREVAGYEVWRQYGIY